MEKNFNNKYEKYIKFLNLFLPFFIKEKKKNEINISMVKRVVLVNISLIGDTIMTIPYYKTIRRNLPDSYITIVGNPVLKDYILAQGLADEFYSIDLLKTLATPKSWLKNRKKISEAIRFLNRVEYDLAIEPRGDFRYLMFMHYIKSKYKVSYNVMDADYLLTNCIKYPSEIKHDAEKKLYLLSKIGMKIYDEDKFPELQLTLEDKCENKRYIVEKGFEKKKIIGIHPGASQLIKQYRKYPEMMEMVSKRIKKLGEFVCIVFCGPGEEKLAEDVCNRIKRNQIESIVFCGSLSEYIKKVGICDFMICNDSGAGHIAAAYGIPVTVFFGPIDDQQFRPLGKNKVNVVSHHLKCKPCLKPECPLGTEECIRGITAEEGADAVMEMIINQGA